MPRTRAYPGSWVVVLLSVATVISALTLAYWLLYFPTNDLLQCAYAPNASLYGEATRSWLPPDTTCTWTLGGTTHVVEPELSRLAVVALAVLGGPLAYYLHRCLRGAGVRRPESVEARAAGPESGGRHVPVIRVRPGPERGLTLRGD